MELAQLGVTDKHSNKNNIDDFFFFSKPLHLLCSFEAFPMGNGALFCLCLFPSWTDRSEVERSRPAALLVSQLSNTITTEFRLFVVPAASTLQSLTAEDELIDLLLS